MQGGSLAAEAFGTGVVATVGAGAGAGEGGVPSEGAKAGTPTADHQKAQPAVSQVHCQPMLPCTPSAMQPCDHMCWSPLGPPLRVLLSYSCGLQAEAQKCIGPHCLCIRCMAFSERWSIGCLKALITYLLNWQVSPLVYLLLARASADRSLQLVSELWECRPGSISIMCGRRQVILLER